MLSDPEIANRVQSCVSPALSQRASREIPGMFLVGMAPDKLPLYTCKPLRVKHLRR
jgi:hypothetical protein